MASLARWCFEHRWRVLAGWLLILVAMAGVSKAAGTSFNTNLSLPGYRLAGGGYPAGHELPGRSRAKATRW